MVTLLLGIIYLAFISLGLPDALLGSAWPTIHVEMNVPISYAGGISMIIALGTIISSLMSDRMTLRFGTGRVTACSVAMTALALFGFSISHSYWMLCLWAIPYGLGAGSVDASLNNYVAIHYASRHMSWLHCMWGIGCSIGPTIMGAALSSGRPWNTGYRWISILQVALSAILFFSLPLWKSRSGEASENAVLQKPLSLPEILRLPGAPEVMITFFCYCAVEQLPMLWASSYVVERCGLSAEQAASWGSFFCMGIAVGRAISGFITMKLNDVQMIRMGEGIILVGILILLLPFGGIAPMIGLILVGLGCAPIYPCVIHSTPAHFGEKNSQAVIGVQMASAYTGTCLLPPLFGLIARAFSITLFPYFLLIALLAMIVMHERLCRKSPI